MAPTTDDSTVLAVSGEYVESNGMWLLPSSDAVAALTIRPTSAPVIGTTQRLPLRYCRIRNLRLQDTARSVLAPREQHGQRLGRGVRPAGGVLALLAGGPQGAVPGERAGHGGDPAGPLGGGRQVLARRVRREAGQVGVADRQHPGVARVGGEDGGRHPQRD